MFILIEDVKGHFYSVKKSDIRRVYHDEMSGNTYVIFTSKASTPIKIPQSVKEFHEVYLK